MSAKITLSHIVAASKNNCIGVNGELPWDIPEDMKFFRSTTKNKIIIMGRKTFESVGHPLPHRMNLIVTRQSEYQAKDSHVFSSIEDAIEYAKTHVDKYDPEIFIIGGGEIYKQSIDLVDRIYITRIDKEIEGDAFYPDIPEDRFKLVAQSDRTEPVPFSFLTFERK